MIPSTAVRITKRHNHIFVSIKDRLLNRKYYCGGGRHFSASSSGEGGGNSKFPSSAATPDVSSIPVDELKELAAANAGTNWKKTYWKNSRGGHIHERIILNSIFTFFFGQ